MGIKVTNENGTDLFTFPLQRELYLDFVSAGQNGAKMIITYRPSEGLPMNYDIYSLPGQLSRVNTITSENIEINAFPNPTKNNITISYDIPEGNYEGYLIIYSSSGVAISSYKVDKNFDTLFIDTSGFPSGIYLYKVIAGNVESNTKKFIIE